MKRTCFIPMLLACAISCVMFKAATSKPMIQRAPVLSGSILNGGRTLPQVGNMIIGAPIPLMTDALNYAKIGRIGNNGARTAIYATVLLASPGSQSVAGRQQITYANGVMRLEGKNRDRLVGDLALYDNAGTDNPFRQNVGGSLHLVIYADGTAFLTVKSPPYNGISFAKKATFKPTGTKGMLWGSAKFSRMQETMVSIGLNKGVDPLESNVAAPPSPPAGPRGMRVRVSPAFTVKNSYDGAGVFGKDYTIELFGSLYLGNQQVWQRKYDNELSSKKGNVILGQSVEVDVIYDNPDTWRLRVRGDVEDSDKPTIDGDIVWKNDTEVDLKKAVEQNNGVIALNGVADDEYADLKLAVVKLSDIN